MPGLLLVISTVALLVCTYFLWELHKERTPRANLRGVLQVAGVVAFLVFALWFMYYLSVVFTPLLLGLALAYILNPFVDWLEKRGLSRKSACYLVSGGLFLGLVLLLLLIVPIVVGQITDSAKELPRHAREFLQRLEDPETLAGRVYIKLSENPQLGTALEEWRRALPRQLEAFSQQILVWLGDVAKLLWNMGWSLLGILLALLLIPVYTFLFLLELNRIYEVLVGYIPRSVRAKTLEILGRIDAAVAGFFRGRLIICLLIALWTATGFQILAVPFGLVLGLFVGACSIVPLVPLVVMIPITILCALHLPYHEMGWPWLLLVVGVYATGQGWDFVLTPLIMRRMTHLHIITILVALLVFGVLLGAVGLLLAIPLAATLKILGAELVLPQLRELAEK